MDRLNRAALLDALRRCRPALAKAGNRAVELTTFWFDGDAVSAYNGRLAIFASLPVPTALQGGVEHTLFRWLLDAEGEEVTLAVDGTNAIVQVGASEARFALLPKDRQPLKSEEAEAMMPPVKTGVSLDPEFVAGLDNVLISLDPMSAVLARMGAFFVPGDEHLDIYATDDVSISWLRLPLPAGFATDTPFVLVPTGFLRQLVNMVRPSRLAAADQDEEPPGAEGSEERRRVVVDDPEPPPPESEPAQEVQLYIHGRAAVALADGVLAIGHLIDHQIMPDFVGELTLFRTAPNYPVPSETLRAALRRLMLLKTAAAQFTVRDEILAIRTERAQGVLRESVQLPLHPDITDVYYNPELVLRALRGRETILITDGVMRLAGPDNFIHLIASTER